MPRQSSGFFSGDPCDVKNIGGLSPSELTSLDTAGSRV